MKYLLALLLLVSVSATAQYSPTAAKTRFVNGIGLGSKDTLTMNAADTVAMIVGRDSVVYFRYKGYWKSLAYNTSLTGYVPYVGATADVDLDTHILNAQALHAKGTAGNGHVGLKHQSAAVTGTANESNIYANASGNMSWLNGNNYLSVFATSANTAARTYTFPNTSGTVILSGDTASMLSPYIRTANFGLTKTSQGLSVDTALMATRLRVQKGIDSLGSVVSGGYVPYTGATGAVNLGAYDLTVNSMTVGKGGNAVATNTVVGYQAGNVLNSSSSYNVFLGYQSGLYNTSGTDNIFLGWGRTLNTTGSNNVFLGSGAGLSNQTGVKNIFIGSYAGQSATGSTNLGIGYTSLGNLVTGTNNIGLGENAGRYISGGASNTITNNSIFIGVSTNALANSQTNQIVIGYNETGLGSNTTILGNSSTVTTAVRGRLLLGSTFDDGSNQLQVTGSSKFTGNITTTADIIHAGDILNTTGNAGGNTLSGGSAYNTGGNIRVYPSTNSSFPSAIQFYTSSSYVAQFFSTGNLSVGSTSDIASAILQVTSTTKGFLPPRMTTTQRDAIATPATGLQVYNTTTNTNDFYNGSAWASGASGSYVTSVTGTSPIVSSGGTTPAISIPVATTSVNGYLSSTDWTTFNNKASTASLANYLPLAGGTLTGALNGTSATFSSSVTATQGFFNGIATNGTPSSQGTSANFAEFRNTGGDFYIGQESSTAGGFFTGSSAYASVLYSGTAQEFIIGGVRRLQIASTGAATFSSSIAATSGTFTGGLIVNNNSSSSPFELNNTLTSNYLFINSPVALEAMTRYYNPTAGNWYTGIRASAGLGTTASYHIFSSTYGADVAVFNTDGNSKFAGAATFSSTLGINGVSDNVKSGTYTPTIGLITNAASSTAYTCQYMRVGNTVTVSGIVAITATTLGTNTRISMTLPVSSSFDFAYRAGGGGGARGTTIVSVVSAGASTSTVLMDFTPLTTSMYDYYFSYTYLVM